MLKYFTFSLVALFAAVQVFNIDAERLLPTDKNASIDVLGDALVDGKISKAIIQHYQNLYKEDGRMDTPEVNSQDSTLDVTFYFKATEDEEEHWMMTIRVPLYKSRYLYGDINGDQVEEVVASVQTEGGGGGGNVGWNEIFVLRPSADGFSVIAYYPSYEICGCEGGLFYPERIASGTLKGKTLCPSATYFEPRCCPSDAFNSVLRWNGNSLAFQSKTPRSEKIADFASFFQRFKTDMGFQIARTKFPLSVWSWDDDYERQVVEKVNKDDWEPIQFSQDGEEPSPDEEPVARFLNNYGDTIKYEIRGTGSGISFDYQFLIQEGKWYLIAFCNYST